MTANPPLERFDMAMKPQTSIVFTDVDGTLVGADHHPLPASAPTLQRVARRIPVCLVSARSPEGLYPIQQQLGFGGPLACYSGAYVLDEDGTELLSETFDAVVAADVKRSIKEVFPAVTIGAYGFHDWIVDDRNDPRIQHEEFLVQAQSRACGDLLVAFGSSGLHKLLVMGEPDQIKEIQSQYSARYPELNVVRSSATLCEIMSKAASKSRAVRVICSHYGIDLANAVAFGDGPNDLDMLETVATSYAMANAEDVVKLAATHVLPWTNEKCGVSRALDELLP